MNEIAEDYINDRTIFISGMYALAGKHGKDELTIGYDWHFPAGEYGVRYTQGDGMTEVMRNKDAPVWLRLTNGSADATIQLLMHNDALRRMGYKDIRLFMPYVPYGRQDRVTASGTAFSLEVFAKLINNALFDQVIVIDPHSQVTVSLLDRVRVIPADAAMGQFPFHLLPRPIFEHILVAPDKGAVDRVNACAKTLGMGSDRVIYATKERDSESGRLKITGIHRPFEGGEDKDLLVIDDICDGGATFIELAKYLKSVGFTQKPTLYVTHGIFSKGLAELREHYQCIIATDSFWSFDAYRKSPEPDGVINCVTLL